MGRERKRVNMQEMLNEMEYRRTNIKSNRSARWKEQREWGNGELIGNVWGNY